MATLNFQHVLTPQWTLLIRCTTMHFAAWMLLSIHMAPSSGKVKSLSNMERSLPGMMSPLDSSSGSSFGKDGSSALSFYSSTLTVSCTNLPTSFPISFSSSSIPVFSFPESLRNVSVALLNTSFALCMTLSLSHLFLSPASSGVVLCYLPEDQNSASQLTHKAKQNGFSARQHARFLPGSLSNVGQEGPSAMPALLQFVRLVRIDHIFGWQTHQSLALLPTWN